VPETLIAPSKFLISGGLGGDQSSSQSQQQARKAIEAPDNLFSNSKAEIVLAVSEGEIEGLKDGAQGILIDGTPLQNPDGSLNFSGGTEYWFQNGTPTQPYIPLGNGSAYAASVGLAVAQGTPIVRTITNLDTNEVRIVLSANAFKESNPENGDTNGSLVTMRIKINGQVILEPTIQGAASSTFEKQYSLILPGTGPWNIEVSRLTPNSTSANRVNTIFWSTYTGIIHGKLNYPNTAVAGFRLDAKQFSSIPSIYFLIRGRKVRIPTNASVDYATGRLSYSGPWNGTFKIAWCSCPAWCFYDILTNTRYGLGNAIQSVIIDKWNLYSISQYCNELVSTGFSDGSQEARFSCNLVLETSQEAYNVLKDFASLFQSILSLSNGQIKAIQDRPEDPVKSFSPSNVIDGIFNYAGSDRKAIHTTAEVSWNNPKNVYQLEKEFVSIDRQVIKYGVRPLRSIAYGCTSRGQAHRVGLYQLLTEELQGQGISFSTGPEGGEIEPGQIFRIFDPLRTKGKRYSGRIKSIDYISGLITLDQSIEIDTTKQYQIYVSNPSPKVKLTGTIQSTGATVVTSSLADFLGDKRSEHGTIGNIRGVLSRLGTTYTFERDAAGDITPIVADFISDSVRQATQPMVRYVANGAAVGAIVEISKIGYEYGWRQDPQKFSLWSVDELTSTPSLWRLVGRKENNDGTYTLEGISYNPQKNELVEQNLALNPSLSPVARQRVPKVSNVNTEVHTYNPQGSGTIDLQGSGGTGGIFGSGAAPLIAPGACTINNLEIRRSSLSIVLGWIVPSVSTASIKIYRAINAGAFALYQSFGGALTTSFTDTGLTANTTYKYKIIASNQAGDSPESNTVEGFMPATVYVPTQTAFTGVGQTGSGNPELLLTWANVAGVEYWDLFRSTGGPAQFYARFPANQLSFVDTNVTWSTTYGYAITGCSSGGCAPWSGTGLGTTRAAPVPPAPPQQIPPSPTNVRYNTNGSLLQWDAGGAVERFDIYHYDNAAGWVLVDQQGGGVRQAVENNAYLIYAIISVNSAGRSNSGKTQYGTNIPGPY
jgi:Putative phage tail protein